MKWIDIKTKQPKEEQEVICAEWLDGYGYKLWFATYRYGFFYYHHSAEVSNFNGATKMEIYRRLDCITHWMPKPEDPVK